MGALPLVLFLDVTGRLMYPCNPPEPWLWELSPWYFSLMSQEGLCTLATPRAVVMGALPLVLFLDVTGRLMYPCNPPEPWLWELSPWYFSLMSQEGLCTFATPRAVVMGALPLVLCLDVTGRLMYPCNPQSCVHGSSPSGSVP